MADINGLFSRASAGQRAVSSYLTAQKPIGADRISVFDLSTWDNSGPVHFSLYALDQNGARDANTQTDWKGIVSGSSIINIQLRAGNDTVYPQNSPVVATISAGWANDLITGITTSLDQNGALKPGAVYNADALASGVVTGAKIAASAVSSSNINYPSIPWASFTFAGTGGTGGQVVNGDTAINFDQFDTNGHTGITSSGNGVMLLANAGVYALTLSVRTESRSSNGTHIACIEYSTVSDFSTNVGQWAGWNSDLTNDIDRSLVRTATGYAPANSYFRARISNNASTRYAASNALSKYQFSFMAVRVA